MIAQERWFDRRFPLEIERARFPGIVERLRGTPARLEERVRGLAPAQATHHVGGAWSIQENVGHLGDLEPLWLARVEDLAAARPVLTAADLENKKTHAANHDAARLADLLRIFRASRARFVARLDEADEALLAAVARHPRLGTPMHLVELAFFVAEHDDHHLATITRLFGSQGTAPRPGAGAREPCSS